jgi:hypothetical protein
MMPVWAAESKAKSHGGDSLLYVAHYCDYALKAERASLTDRGPRSVRLRRFLMIYDSSKMEHWKAGKNRRGCCHFLSERSVGSVKLWMVAHLKPYLSAFVSFDSA